MFKVPNIPTEKTNMKRDKLAWITVRIKVAHFITGVSPQKKQASVSGVLVHLPRRQL